MKKRLERAIRNQLKLIQNLTECAETIFIYPDKNTILSSFQSRNDTNHLKNVLTTYFLNNLLKNSTRNISLNKESFSHIKSIAQFHHIDIFPFHIEKSHQAFLLLLFDEESKSQIQESLAIICESIASFYEAYEEKVEISKSSLASDLLLSTIQGVPWSLNFNTGLFSYIGPQAEQILSFKPQEIESMDDWVNIIHPEDQEKSLNYCKKESIAGNDHVFDYRVIKKDGTIIWIQDIIKVIHNNNNSIQLYGFMIDITDTKEQELQLENLHNQLKYILKYSNTVLNIVDDKQNIIYHTNKNAENIKLKCYEYFCKLKNQCNDCPALKTKIEPTKYYREIGDSTYLVNAFPITTKEGKIHIGEVRVDISDRARKEKQINDLNNKIEFLLTSGNISYIEHNLETEIFNCNRVFTEITGYDLNNIVLNTDWLLSRIHPNNIKLFKSEINKVINRTKQQLDVEFRFLTAENKYIWFHFHGQIDKKNTTKLVGILLNITNNKKLLNDLIDAKNKSVHANELKSKFLANMSHEIRTPMNAIIGFTNLLKSHITEAPFNNYINSIESSGKTLLELINELLDLEKINSGKMEIKKEKVNLNFILNEIYQTFIIFVNNKGITLEIIKQGDIPNEVYIDSLKLKQILINLINNAIKFTNKGSIKIKYAFIKNSDHKSGTLNISVIDTGIGISIEMQKNIFEPFIQDDSNVNSPQEGTGLGLSIVQKVINLMNGSIVLESAPGIGSKFSISIPDVLYFNSLNTSIQIKKQNNIDIEPIISQEGSNMLDNLSNEEIKIARVEFENNLIPLWEQLTEMISLTNLNIFLKGINKLLEQVNWTDLKEYSILLYSNIKSFDFEQLPIQIKDFEKFILFIQNKL
ncbi:PAS domain-containing hybrid sensor histidine kinase/response regulator [Plebeiibacterium sediminum]|uniref:histidine kinase n=1 Tax=Plebeiibacterium sediminum TaxID=2992112 RepID=A0AAE3SF44_9BACT|nr:PAS domain-containing hybrid sensor histidine kinase/response regulator [Plebeiobacterium sediminum]MCW3787080.1 PAS domain-containing protein [Plebeiobacterium sediminum]